MYWIRGKNVWMRPMAAGDAEVIVGWRQQAEIAYFLVDWEPLTVDRQEQWFAASQAAGDVNLMFDTPAGRPLGTSAYCNFDRLRKVAEFGRVCRGVDRESAWGMKDAFYLCHRFVFELLGVERTHFATSIENVPVQRLTLFFGYQQEGHRRRHLATPRGYVDLLEYGLLADEFAARRGEMERAIYGDDPVPRFEPEAYRAAEHYRAFRGK